MPVAAGAQLELKPLIVLTASARLVARVTVNRGTPRKSFGFTFVSNARQDKRVMARLSKFHRVPLTLFADGLHPARFPVDRHPIDHPQQRFLGLSHLASSPQKTASLPFDLTCQCPFFKKPTPT